MISTFKVDFGGCLGCGGWDPSGFCGDCGGRSDFSGLCGVFSTVFISYLNHLPSKTTPSVLSLY